MRVLTAMMAIGLAACQQAPDPKAEHLARQNDTTIVNPPGRFQAVANPRGDGVYVLDTRMGAVRLCVASSREADGNDFADVVVGCSPPAS